MYVCPERFYAFGFALNARLNFSLFPGDISISGPTGENESMIVFYAKYSCSADSPYFGTPPYIFPEVWYLYLYMFNSKSKPFRPTS